MIKKLKTSIEFTKYLFVTGAITETSKRVEKEICKFIPNGNNKIVVEFGMGHGNITKEILKTISSNSKLYSFEVNKKFCEYVKSEINDDRLIIINDGAENIYKYFDSNVDSIISSIPFSFFSKEKCDAILNNSYLVLSNRSYYSQVLYTRFNFKKFLPVFDNCQLFKFSYLPTEYIYHCQKLLK